MKKENDEQLTPSQYFDYIKNAKNTITTKMLKDSYGVFIKLGEKYSKLGQKESLKKLCFLADTIKKEEKLIEIGITTFVYKDVIEDYIENVSDKSVKIVELSRYMREIPDELVEVVEKTKNIFDQLYVVFTDYTGIEERKIEKERRDKDPILFGVFKNDRNVADRFYFIGDWVDEYCDLTLDKMIDEYKSVNGYSPVIDAQYPKSTDDLITILNSYQIDDKNDRGYAITVSDQDTPLRPYIISNANIQNSRSRFFDKIRWFLKKIKK